MHLVIVRPVRTSLMIGVRSNGKIQGVGFAKDYGTCSARPFDYARDHWELLNEVAVVFIPIRPTSVWHFGKRTNLVPSEETVEILSYRTH